MALYLILVEKGGICIMIDSQCCTLIPHNTPPDGTISKALQDLTILANELEDSGIDDPFSNLMGRGAGREKGIVTSILSSVIVMLGE